MSILSDKRQLSPKDSHCIKTSTFDVQNTHTAFPKERYLQWGPSKYRVSSKHATPPKLVYIFVSVPFIHLRGACRITHHRVNKTIQKYVFSERAILCRHLGIYCLMCFMIFALSCLSSCHIERLPLKMG